MTVQRGSMTCTNMTSRRGVGVQFMQLVIQLCRAKILLPNVQVRFHQLDPVHLGAKKVTLCLYLEAMMVGRQRDF